MHEAWGKTLAWLQSSLIYKVEIKNLLSIFYVDIKLSSQRVHLLFWIFKKREEKNE